MTPPRNIAPEVQSTTCNNWLASKKLVGPARWRASLAYELSFSTRGQRKGSTIFVKWLKRKGNKAVENANSKRAALQRSGRATTLGSPYSGSPGRSDPPISGKGALFSGDCAGNQRREFRYGRVQDIEKLTQATAAVGCLLLQFRHHERLVPLGRFRSGTIVGVMLGYPTVARCSGLKWRRLRVKIIDAGHGPRRPTHDDLFHHSPS